MSCRIICRTVPLVILVLAGCGDPTIDKPEDDAGAPTDEDDADVEEFTESDDSGEPGETDEPQNVYTLDVAPEAIVAEVGQTFDIDMSAVFFDSETVERFTFAYTVEEPADVVIWAGAFVVSSTTLPINGEQSNPNSNTASFWMEQFSEETLSATITGQCERAGDTTIEVVSTRLQNGSEGARQAVVPVTCTAGVPEGPSVARVRYEDHQPSCTDLGMEVECGAGTRLSAVELACLEPTLRPGGDPTVATDIDCAGGLEWLGEFDAGLTHDRRNFGIFLDGDRDATTGSGGTRTFGNDISVHLSQQTGAEGTEVLINVWTGMEPTPIEPEVGWQCLKSDSGDTCDPATEIVGGRINPVDGFPITLGLRFDLQVDGFEGEMVYSDLPPRLGTFSTEEGSAFEAVATWILEGTPQLVPWEYQLQRILD